MSRLNDDDDIDDDPSLYVPESPPYQAEDDEELTPLCVEDADDIPSTPLGDDDHDVEGDSYGEGDPGESTQDLDEDSPSEFEQWLDRAMLIQQRDEKRGDDARRAAAERSQILEDRLLALRKNTTTVFDDLPPLEHSTQSQSQDEKETEVLRPITRTVHAVSDSARFFQQMDAEIEQMFGNTANTQVI